MSKYYNGYEWYGRTLDTASPEITAKERCANCDQEFQVGESVTFRQVGFGMDVTVHCDCPEPRKGP